MSKRRTTTTIDYGGGVEVGRIGGAATTAAAPIDELDVGAARLLRDQPAQPVGQEPIGDAVWPRHAARRESRRSTTPEPTDDRRLRLQRLSRPVHLPRAARVRHHRRCAVHRLRRAGPALELHLQPPGRDRRLRAPHRRLHGHRPLHLRLHQAVRRADRGRGSAADRSPVPAGQAVEGVRRRAARFARRRARSAARRGGRHRRLGGGARSSGRKSASSRPSRRASSIAACRAAAWCSPPARGSASPSGFAQEVPPVARDRSPASADPRRAGAAAVDARATR